MLLHIDVVNKVATYRKRDGDIVCGNSDYQLQFTFDSEWDAHATKTARFIYNGGYTDVEFTGDTCDVPVINNATQVTVGVYAGELATTTPAEIRCRLSILCLAAKPSEENERNYASEAQEAAERAESAAERAEAVGGGVSKDELDSAIAVAIEAHNRDGTAHAGLIDAVDGLDAALTNLTTKVTALENAKPDMSGYVTTEQFESALGAYITDIDALVGSGA